MTDQQNNVDPTAAPVNADAPSGGKLGFLNTRTGKFVVGGVALVLVLGAIGAAVAFFVIGGALDGAVDEIAIPPVSSTVPGSSPSTQTPVNPEQSSLASSFTFRNVFAPTVKKTFETTAAVPGSSTDTTDTDTGVNVPADTLYLQSIVTEDGEQKAVFLWNDQTYTVAEGEQVGTTPWKVIQINSDTVLMLFGDSQVTLSVGQGVSK